MSQREWYIVLSGPPWTTGPHTSQQLRQLAAEGKIQPDTRLEGSGLKEPVPASRVKGLFGQPTPPPTVEPHDTDSQTERLAIGEQYYCRIGEKPEGPYTVGQLRKLVKEGRINPLTMVCRYGTGDWTQADWVPGLFIGPRITAKDMRPTRGSKSNKGLLLGFAAVVLLCGLVIGGSLLLQKRRHDAEIVARHAALQRERDQELQAEQERLQEQKRLNEQLRIERLERQQRQEEQQRLEEQRQQEELRRLEAENRQKEQERMQAESAALKKKLEDSQRELAALKAKKPIEWHTGLSRPEIAFVESIASYVKKLESKRPEGKFLPYEQKCVKLAQMLREYRERDGLDHYSESTLRKLEPEFKSLLTKVFNLAGDDPVVSDEEIERANDRILAEAARRYDALRTTEKVYYSAAFQYISVGIIALKTGDRETIRQTFRSMSPQGDRIEDVFALTGVGNVRLKYNGKWQRLDELWTVGYRIAFVE